MATQTIEIMNIPENKRVDVVIGIDPDVDKNGVAVLDVRERALSVATRAFPQLIEQLHGEHKKAQENAKKLCVYVEAGWLNQSNWHLTYRDTKAVAAAKGNAAGRNHEVGRKIIEMCEYYGIDVEAVKPFRKCWKGKDGKITQQEIEAVTGQKIGRTNQEGRDATLIAWVCANLPIKLKMKF